MKNIVKLTVFLAIVAGLAGGALSFVNGMTYPIIQEQKIASVKENLVKIYSNGEEFKALEVSLSDYPALVSVYEADKGGSAVGYIYETAAQGYGGEVKALIALDKDGTYKGLQIIDCSTETKGIGDQVAGEAFISSVVGKNIGDSIDTISGATISSTAVVEGIEQATQHYNENYK